MIDLIMVRHGVTKWNEDRRYIGSTDLGLTEKGLEQAKAASGYLAKENISKLYTSEFKRARQTANIIAKPHDTEICILPELNETDFGKWEGLTFEQIEETWPSFVSKWLANNEGYPPKGELINTFFNRAKSAIEKVLSRESEGTIVIVAHAGTIKLILCNLLGLGLREIWQTKQDSASISRIEIYDDGHCVLTLLNDTCHLNEFDTT